MGANSVFLGVLTSYAKTNALPLIITGLPDHRSISIDYLKRELFIRSAVTIPPVQNFGLTFPGGFDMLAIGLKTGCNSQS